MPAHFLAFRLEEGDCAFPVQGFFFFRAVVEEVHPHAHVDAHGFPGFLARLSVQHVVAHVEAVFERGEGGDGDEAGEEAVGVGVVGGGVEVVQRVVFVVLGHCCEGGEGLCAGFVAGRGGSWFGHGRWVWALIRAVW